MKIGFITLGCVKNRVDSERIMGMLTQANHEIVLDMQDAEMIIINTCGFIDPAKEESIDTILEMAQHKQDNCKHLIVVGCLAQRYKEELIEALPEVDMFIGNHEYHRIHELLSEYTKNELNTPYAKSTRVLSTAPWMSYLKISDGCNNRCTFCAIPLIRGGYKSEPKDKLIAEAQELAAAGVKELVVISQDTTRYGYDLGYKDGLLGLLKELNKIEEFHWIRVLYMYPDEISSELIKGMKSLDKVIPYFDIPLQHANDDLLVAMNRRGTKQEVLDTIELIRETFEMPVLRTTMIVGYPNESRDQFDEMLEFVEEVKWDRLGGFIYSKEEDTKAAEIEDTISDTEKENRLSELMQTQAKVSYENNKKLVGQTLEVLIESYDALKDVYRGRSIFSAPDGIDGLVFVSSDSPLEFGTFHQVLIQDCNTHDLIGEKVE